MELLNLEKLSELLTLYAPKVLGAVVTLIIGFWIAGWLSRLVRRNMEKRNVDATIVPFISSLLNVGIKVLVLLSAARMFGIETTSFVAILGALAFAIGLALQGNLGHLASGILVLFFRPYQVGDFIVAAGYSGTVKEIQIFNTILTTLDARIIIIPNGVITSGPIENLTSPGQRKVDLTFGVSYSDDIDKTRSVIEATAKECPHILHDRGYEVYVKELGDSSVNFATRVWVDVDNYWDAYFWMHEYVKKAFDREGVSIPFPQMDVHLDK